MKRILRMVGVVLVLFLVAILALPFLINVNSFRPQLEAELSSAFGRQVKVGNLKLSILSGSLLAEDLSIADDPAFSQSPFVRAKSVEVGIKLMPLIFSKALEVNELALLQPEIFLVRATSGKWNFSSLGGSPTPVNSPAARGADPPNPNLSIAKLEIKDGRLTVSTQNFSARSQVYDNLNITVLAFSFTSQSPFTLITNLPGGGSAKLDGTAGPVNAMDASLTPLNARILVRRLDLVSSGLVNLSSGIGGLADLNGTVKSDGSQARAQGVLSLDKLKLSPKGQAAARPVQIAYTVTHDFQKRAGEVMQGEITVSKALAQLTGTYQMQGEATLLNMNLNGQGMPVDDLAAMLPALGVVLPSGSSLKGGTLSMNLAINGPADKLVITGPIKLSDTKLAGFDLGAKLATISKLAGMKTGSDTAIENLSTNARVATEGIRTDAINLTIPKLGVLTGAGTISPEGALNYKMNAVLSGSSLPGGLPLVAGLGGASAGIPFAIQGTTSNPMFIPDVKGIASSQLQNPLKSHLPGGTAGSPVDPLHGLLGKKKRN